MKLNEFSHLMFAAFILWAVLATPFIISELYFEIAPALLYSVLIIFVCVFTRKWAAYLLDSDAEHELWKSTGFGFTPHSPRYRKETTFGAILPLAAAVLSFIFQSTVQVMTILTFEGRALRARAAKRFGIYSYTEITEWHNAIIALAGITPLLLMSLIAYLVNAEYLAAAASYYAFWNMLPISNLDGSQIYFGSRVLWSVMAVITLIFAIYTFLI